MMWFLFLARPKAGACSSLPMANLMQLVAATFRGTSIHKALLLPAAHVISPKKLTTLSRGRRLIKGVVSAAGQPSKRYPYLGIWVSFGGRLIEPGCSDAWLLSCCCCCCCCVYLILDSYLTDNIVKQHLMKIFPLAQLEANERFWLHFFGNAFDLFDFADLCFPLWRPEFNSINLPKGRLRGVDSIWRPFILFTRTSSLDSYGLLVINWHGNVYKHINHAANEALVIRVGVVGGSCCYCADRVKFVLRFYIYWITFHPALVCCRLYIWRKNLSSIRKYEIRIMVQG